MRSILATTALVSFAALGTTQNQGIQLVAGIDGAVEVPFDPAMVPPTGLTVEAWITFDESTVPVGSGFYWPTIARRTSPPRARAGCCASVRRTSATAMSSSRCAAARGH